MKKIIKRVIPMILIFAMLIAPISAYAEGLGGIDTVYSDELTGIENALDSELETETVESTELTDSTELTENPETTAEENTEVSEIQAVTSSIYDDAEQADPIDTSLTADPVKVIDAIKKLIDALQKAGASKDTIKSLSDLLGRIGNGASLAGATLTILQMLGLLGGKDSDPIQEIKQILLSQNVKLQNISNQLNSIAETLAKMQAKGALYNRSNTALAHVGYWNTYRDNYLNKMDLCISAYEGWTVSSIYNWAYATSHDNVYAYYTMITPSGETEQVKTQTYSRKKNMALDVSEYGETIEKGYTIGIPGEFITDCMKEYREDQKWNVDTYREDIIECLTVAVKKAMTGDIQLGCSQSFVEAWSAATDAQRNTIAKEVASDLFNSIVYVCSCKGVNANQTTVNQYITLMNQTWNVTKDKAGGLAGQIVPIQMTSCFEGEAKENITSVYSTLASTLSVDSFFTMTIAAQSDIVNAAKRKAVTDQWFEQMNYLGDTSKALTGYDNYCYLTNSLVTLKEVKVSGTSSLTTRSKVPGFGFPKLRNCERDSQPWKLYDSLGKEVTEKNPLKIIDDENALVLYMTWNQNKTTTGTTSFTDYLNKYGTGVSKDYSKSIFIGGFTVENFSKSEGIKMLCVDPAPWAVPKPDIPDHFKKGDLVNVMTDGNKSKYTVLYDKVSVNFFDPSAGSVTMNKLVTARAHYWRSNKVWRIDEPWYFAMITSETTCKQTGLGDYKTKYEYTTSTTMPTLECAAVPAKPTETSSVIADSENVFKPFSVVEEMAIVGVVDASIAAHTDEDILSFADWIDLDLTYLRTVDSDSELRKYINDLFADCISKAGDKGIHIEYTDAEIDAFIKKIIEKYRKLEKDINNNDNMTTDIYLDPFDIYGNDEAMEKLARKVLPESEFATDGKTIDSIENMITAAFYEPCVYMTTEKVGDSYQVVPVLVYEVNPVLLVWCDQDEEYRAFEISNDVMKELGLGMTIRFNTSDAGDNNIANIVHYDDIDEMNAVETKVAKIQGSGDDRYADIYVDSCSPFTITYSKSAVDTGDNNNATIYFIIIGVAAAAIIAGVIVVISRRRRSN